MKMTPHDEFLILCIHAGIPEPRSKSHKDGELRFCPPRRWRFDYAWEDHKIAVEMQGGLWTRGRHSGGTGQVNDMEKFNAAVMCGWRVLQFTPEQVRKGDPISFVKTLIYGNKRSD